MSEDFDHRSRVYTGGTYGRGLPDYYDRTLYTHHGTTPNIFVDTGQIMFITPHLTYDKNVYMCEQGGACCFKEALTQQIDDNRFLLEQLEFLEQVLTMRIPEESYLHFLGKEHQCLLYQIQT